MGLGLGGGAETPNGLRSANLTQEVADVGVESPGASVKLAT